MDVHVHHEVPSQQTLTLLTVHVLVITDSSPVYSTVIPQSIPSFTPPPPLSTPTLPPTTKATNPPSALPDFAFVFQFNNRDSVLEKEVAKLKRDDPLNNQVTTLVDEHLDAILGATRYEFMNYLSAPITAMITEQEGTDAKMTNVQQGNENSEISQVIEDAHVTFSTVLQKTEVLKLFLQWMFTSIMKYQASKLPHSLQYLSQLSLNLYQLPPPTSTFNTIHSQPPPPQSTFTPPLTTEATNPSSTLLDFTSVFQFNNRVTTLEKEVAELKKDDPLKTQVTALVDEHLDARLGATRDEFMNFLLASITTRITEQESSQLQSSYEAAATLTEFELKKILIDKMDKSESYLAVPEHRECYEGLIKSYDLDKTLFSTYDKSGSSKGTKSQPKSFGKSVQLKEPEFKVANLDMLQDQEGNLGNDDEEPKEKTPQQGLNQSWLMTLASSADKPSKTFDELMSTPINFSAYIMNGLKITNLTQETRLGLAFRLLKGTRSNYAELEYEFEECYKDLSEKLD
ncbi:hypothetical protein Tco_0404834 [Tanacetum coccineum]